MRNLKKIISLALALMMVLSMMVTASAAFADADQIDADYAQAVEVMNAIGLLQGDGTNFKPAGTLTRAEAAVILSKAHSGETDVEYFEKETVYTENPFEDVSGWAVPYVLYCYQNEIVGGTSATTYEPTKTVTGYEFAKMLLVAAGFGTHADYVGDETKTWQVKTLEAAKGADLLDGLTITLKNPITREQAAQMALNAMMAGMVSATTYDVVVGGKVVANFSNMLEAYLYAQILEGTVAPNTESTGGLLAEKYGVTYTAVEAGGADKFGRPADVYTIDGEDLCFVVSAAKVYTNTTTAKTVLADLAGAKVVANGATDKTYAITSDAITSWNVTLTVNGDSTTEVATISPAAVIAAYSAPNSVVEIYTTNGVISNVVVIDTFYGVVTDVDKTNGTAKVDGYTFANLDSYTAGTVVSYNLANSKAANVAAVEGFAGVLNTYNNGGYYTINGNVYTLDGYAKDNKSTIEATLATGATLVYYVGANNTIVYAHTPAASAPTPDVVYNNFALVLRTGIAQTGTISGGSILDGFYTIPTYTGAVELLMADGSVVEVAVPVNYATADVKNAAGTVIVAKGNYYYTIGSKTIVLGSEIYMDTLTALDGAVVAYENGTIAFATELSVQTAKKASGNAYTVTADTIYYNVAVDGGVVLNNETVFVVPVYNNKGVLTGYTTIKGQTNLGKGSIVPAGSDMIVAVTYTAATATTPESWSYVAKVVFAPDAVIAAATPVIKTQDYVYNTNSYSIGYDTTYAVMVYTYTMVDSTGAVTLVPVYGAPLATGAGIYELKTDGSVAVVGSVSGTVTGIAGTSVCVDGTWVITDADTVVVGSLSVGAKVCYADLDANGIADLIYVVG